LPLPAARLARGLRERAMQLSKDKQALRVVKMPGRISDHKATVERPRAGRDDYQRHILDYAQKIRDTHDTEEIIQLLGAALEATRGLHTANEVAIARRQVAAAERKISALKTELEEVSELLKEDPLTAALNRRGLDETYTREAARADRRNASLCLVLLDLDNFKRLNDTHGHLAGDQALVQLTRTARSTLRPNDSVARIGGEEFVLLLPDTDLDAALAATRRLATTLAENHMRTSFSAGIALRNTDETLTAILDRADHALYRAKKAGKNRAEVAPQ
jgi:diguanylate cyclase